MVANPETLRHARVERRVQETALGIYHEIPALPAERHPALVKWARESENRHRLAAMQACAQAFPEIATRPSAFDRDSMLLTVANGTLDLRRGELGPHRPEDLITKLVPFVYDPAARCDRWERFMLEITNGRRELVGFLQRGFGSSLTGDTRDQAFFLCHGRGWNGKSVMLNVQRRLRGDYALMADFATFAEQPVEKPRPDLARLAGARMVCAEEPQAVRLSEATLKNLTGGASVVARYLHAREFEFVPQFKLWLGTNERPLIRATDPGMWRRVHLIPFEASFDGEREEKGLEDKLLATEGPGILAWTVAGCLMWQREGLNPPECVRAATAEYRNDSDLVGQFLEERCALGGSVDAGQLYQEYAAWSTAEQGERAMSKQKFGHRLSDRGIKPGHRRKGAGYAKTREGTHLLPVEVLNHRHGETAAAAGE
jgi:putative DNA primase/helicase